MSNSTAEPSAFCTLVTPAACSFAVTAVSTASRSSIVGSGSSRDTRPCALSCSTPVGSPVRGSRTIVPFTGSGVSRVIPASASAFELTQAVW